VTFRVWYREQTKIVSRVNLNAPLPHSLINFLTRKLAGVVLYRMQQQVMKVIKDANCQHAQRIRSNLGFYRDWLLPKLRYYKRRCEVLTVGTCDTQC
jgi:hypothetical protein